MTIVCTVAMTALLAFSDNAMAAARMALGCFGTGVLPALLPMMVLGKLMPHSTKSNASGKTWLSSVFFGWAAGSPAAAQHAAQLNSRLSVKQWECLLCLTGVMSPMFFTGTLASWLGASRDGWKLLGIHWLGAALTAGLWALLAKTDREPPPAQAVPSVAARVRLPEIIAQCSQSLLCVLGAMMTFSVAASLLKSVLSFVFPAWTAQHADWMAVLWAVMEIGGGSSAVIHEIITPHAALSALCGFGGLSIFLQNMLFLDGKIRPARLLLMRAVHGTVSYLLVKTLNPF